jgi:molecular chaperone DnaK (HSP70)
MQPAARAAAVGVDLGSSTTTVSTRRSDHRDTPVGEDEPTLVALAVPATWTSTRRRAHAEAAANAGFEPAFLVSEPEAAARQYAEVQGREPDPGAPLVMLNLGAGSCHVGVVRGEGDCFTVAAAASADDIGGREFDRLLLEHLAARHRQADPEFWARAGDPAETLLREGLLDEVRRAREHLTDHPSATVALPGLGRDLRLTREDLDQCLTPAMLRAVGLVEDAMRDAAVEADRIGDLLLVGGASRTPLLVTVLRHHLGVEPVRPELPDLVIAEGAALAGLARIRSDSGEPAPAPRFARLHASPDVLVTALVVVIAVAAFAGVVLLNRGGSEAGDLGADSVMPTMPDAVNESTAAEPTTVPSPESAAEGSSTPDSEYSEGPSESETPVSPTPSAPATSASASPSRPPTSEAPASSGEVPDVVGRSLADAQRILAEAGFTNVVTEGGRRDTEGPEQEHCEVTAQSPGGGTQSGHDSPITVHYVYVGSDDC